MQINLLFSEIRLDFKPVACKISVFAYLGLACIHSWQIDSYDIIIIFLATALATALVRVSTFYSLLPKFTFVHPVVMQIAPFKVH